MILFTLWLHDYFNQNHSHLHALIFRHQPFLFHFFSSQETETQIHYSLQNHLVPFPVTPFSSSLIKTSLTPSTPSTCIQKDRNKQNTATRSPLPPSFTQLLHSPICTKWNKEEPTTHSFIHFSIHSFIIFISTIYGHIHPIHFSNHLNHFLRR